MLEILRLGIDDGHQDKSRSSIEVEAPRNASRRSVNSITNVVREVYDFGYALGERIKLENPPQSISKPQIVEEVCDYFTDHLVKSLLPNTTDKVIHPPSKLLRAKAHSV